MLLLLGFHATSRGRRSLRPEGSSLPPKSATVKAFRDVKSQQKACNTAKHPMTPSQDPFIKQMRKYRTPIETAVKPSRFIRMLRLTRLFRLVRTLRFEIFYELKMMVLGAASLRV